MGAEVLDESNPAPDAADDERPADTEAAPSRRHRLEARVARLKDESIEFLSGLERIRPESRTVSAGFLIFERDREFPASLLTGALAARIVIFIIPFMMLIIFALGLGADLATTSAEEAAQEAGLPGMFAEAAGDAAVASGQWRFLGLAFTAFAMVWAANGLGRTVRLATSVVWRSPRQRARRRWLLPLTVIGFGLAALTVNAISKQLNQPGAVDDIVRMMVELVIIAGLWLVASLYLPHDAAATRWRDFVPGALLMALALITLRAAMVLYLIPKWDTLSARYGDIGIVLVMLSFAYIVGYAVVASAHVNAAVFYTQRETTQGAPEQRGSPLIDLLKEERESWRGRRSD